MSHENPSEKKKFGPKIKKEYTIKDKRGKEVLTVKLIDGESRIFIDDEELMLCKFVPLAIPAEDLPKFKNIESINDVIDHLDYSLAHADWKELSEKKRKELEDLDFFVNCSNLQAWVEHDYNTRLLDYRLSFPILKELAKKGDEYARMRFKEELIERWCHGSTEVKKYLWESYDILKELSEEEYYSMYEPKTAKILEEVDKNRDYSVIREDMNIRYLSLYMENRDKLALLPTISKLPKLMALKLKLPPHSEKDVECLKNLQNLMYLKIEFCDAGPLLEIATSLKNLGRLEIVTDDQFHFPKEAGNLAKLTCLRIGGKFKEFPSNIGTMRSLKELELFGSKYEALSEEIGHLTNLERLVIACFNAKEGTTGLPDSIGNLTKVKEIYFMFCPSLKHLPDSFGNLTSLEFFYIGDCPSLEQLPDSFGNLTSLEYLYIENCPSLEQLSDSFGKLPSLKKLEIINCPLLKRFPESFGYLTSLKELIIENTSIEDFPANSENLTALKKLEIHKHLSEYLPARIGELKAIKTIRVEDSPKIKKMPSSWASLTSLEDLVMNDCGLTEFPKRACDIQSLKFLSLNHNKIESIPDDILKLKNLRILRMHHNKIKELNPCLADLPSIEYMSFRNNLITKVPKKFVKLVKTPFKTLNLRENSVHYVPPELRTSLIVKLK